MGESIDRWRVTLSSKSGQRKVIVQGISQFAAIMAAAQLWHIPWTMIVRGCTIEKIVEEEADVSV